MKSRNVYYGDFKAYFRSKIKLITFKSQMTSIKTLFPDFHSFGENRGKIHFYLTPTPLESYEIKIYLGNTLGPSDKT